MLICISTFILDIREEPLQLGWLVEALDNKDVVRFAWNPSGVGAACWVDGALKCYLKDGAPRALRGIALPIVLHAFQVITSSLVKIRVDFIDLHKVQRGPRAKYHASIKWHDSAIAMTSLVCDDLKGILYGVQHKLEQYEEELRDAPPF